MQNVPVGQSELMGIVTMHSMEIPGTSSKDHSPVGPM